MAPDLVPKSGTNFGAAFEHRGAEKRHRLKPQSGTNQCSVSTLANTDNLRRNGIALHKDTHPHTLLNINKRIGGVVGI